MERISEERIGIYLYIACYNNAAQKGDAFIAVTKAILYDEVAIIMENLGDHAILFTSLMSIPEIKEKLKHKQTQYLLIDLSVSYDLESLSCFLPESKIEMIKNLTDNKFSKNKIRLKYLLGEALEKENFELAAPLRDLTKEKE